MPRKKKEKLTATLKEVNATLEKELNLDLNSNNISCREDVLQKLSDTQTSSLHPVLQAYDELREAFLVCLSSLPPEVRKDIISSFREHLAHFMENTEQVKPGS